MRNIKAGLLEVDALAMNEEDLAASIALIRGWQWCVYRGYERPTRFLSPSCPEDSEPWDGAEEVRIAPATWRRIPRPDSDPAAAVELLCEMAERWQDAVLNLQSIQWSGDEPAIWVNVGLSIWPVEPSVFVKGKPTPKTFCLAVCRAYLLAWQTERKTDKKG